MNFYHRNKLSRFISIFAYAIFIQYEVQYQTWLRSSLKSELGLGRRKKERIKWAAVNERISDMHFRRMRRMIRDWCSLFCERIIFAVSEEEFKSESYIETV